MEDLLIGIDLSLDSSGVTFRQGNKTTFLSILNIGKFTKSKSATPHNILEEGVISNADTRDMLIKLASLDSVDIKFVKRESIPTTKTVGLCEWQRLHMSSSISLSKQIYEAILSHIKRFYPNVDLEKIHINIENYSYGSVTDNLIQVVELTCLLKKLLITELIDLENWYIVAGPTVKKFVGKGNYDKYDMLQAFINGDVSDEHMDGSDFVSTLKEMGDGCWDLKKKKSKEIKEVKSPIDDLIDSYYMMIYLKQVYL